MCAEYMPLVHIDCGQNRTMYGGATPLHTAVTSWLQVWRVQHPQTDNIFSVWEERVANRLINKVCSS